MIGRRSSGKKERVCLEGEGGEEGQGVLTNRDPLFSTLEGWFNREGGYSCGKLRYDVQRRLASSHFERRPEKHPQNRRSWSRKT